ncbi:hypothetical protein P8452_46600 [Trifolium repens]|nr:hypothetical protein P8452_46600 [Trifolium repens]
MLCPPCPFFPKRLCLEIVKDVESQLGFSERLVTASRPAIGNMFKRCESLLNSGGIAKALWGFFCESLLNSGGIAKALWVFFLQDLQFVAVDVLSFGERAMNVLWDLEAFEPLDSIGYFFPQVFVLRAEIRIIEIGSKTFCNS